MYRIAVLTISDKCSGGEREDKSGRVVQELVRDMPAEIVRYEIIPDEPNLIRDKLIEYSDMLRADIVLTNGGTGFGPRDVTPEATRDVIEREIPGIPEVMRAEGLKSTKKALLSRNIAGLRGSTIIINLPGSSRGAKESLEAVVDILPHAVAMVKGMGH